MVRNGEGLDIAFIVFRVPELLAAVCLTAHCGSNRSMGWIFLVLLGLVRVIISCYQIVALNQINPNITLYKIAFIFKQRRTIATARRNT